MHFFQVILLTAPRSSRTIGLKPLVPGKYRAVKRVFPDSKRSYCRPGAGAVGLQSDEGSVPEKQVVVTTEERLRNYWTDVWGIVWAKAFYTGDRVAPNGVVFSPIFALGMNFNMGILPNQKLYLFTDTVFWGQKPDISGGITNGHQGIFDYSKREFDLAMGFAWNYWGPWEARAFAYSYNNLNRGLSPTQPSGYSDGVGLENRFYLPCVDPYDVGKRSFLSLGYYPSKTMVGGDGQGFSPGLFARVYLTWELHWWGSYLYGDGQYIGEQGIKPRLLNFDGASATSPIRQLTEYRISVRFFRQFRRASRRQSLARLRRPSILVLRLHLTASQGRRNLLSLQQVAHDIQDFIGNEIAGKFIDGIINL